MEYGEEGELHIGHELREDIVPILIEQVRDTTGAHEDRDNDIADCADYANGVAPPKYRPSFPGGSELVNPTIPKEVTTLEASLVSPLMQQNIAQVAAKNDNDKTSAKVIEAWENDKAEEEGFAEAYHGYIHNLIVYPFSVLRMLWRDIVKPVKRIEYWDGESRLEDGETPLTIPAENRDPNFEYEEIEVDDEEVEKSGAVYSVVNPVDFYLVPPTARSIETAVGTIERMVLNVSDLLAGIDAFGYEEDPVMELIKLGGTLSTNDYRDNQNDNAGVTQDAAQNGEYECFMFIGSLPYLWEDGKARLPKKFWGKPFCAMICPDHNIVFKLAESPYPESPYFMDSLFPDPNRAYGQGFVQRVMGLSDSVTHYSRASEDILDIEINPVFAMDEETWESNKGFEFYPGARFVKTEQGTLEAVQLPNRGMIPLNMAQYFEGQIKDIAAAQGFGVMDEKQRKNGEIANMQNAVVTKFNLLKYVAYRNAPKAFRRRPVYQVMFGGGSDTTFVDGAQSDVSEEDLKKAYRFSVAQTNADSSDEAQIAKSQAILELQTRYLQAKMAAAVNPMTGMPGMPPEDLELVYNAISDALPVYDVREPERIIGKKPEPPPMNPMMQGMAANPMGAMMAGGVPNGQPAENGAFVAPVG